MYDFQEQSVFFLIQNLTLGLRNNKGKNWVFQLKCCFFCVPVSRNTEKRGRKSMKKTCKQTIRGEKSRRENGKTYMLHFSELIPPRAPVKMHKSANIGMRRNITGLTSFSSHSNNHVGARRGDDCRFVSTIFRSFPGHLR